MKNKHGISNVTIVHGSAFTDKEKVKAGYPPINERHWTPWVKTELKKLDIDAKNPLMPKNYCPNYENWEQEFEKIILDKNSILIGHSRGAAFLVRYLSKHKIKIKKLILIAPSIIQPQYYEKCFHDFSDFEIDPTIKNRVKKLIIFISNDTSHILESTDSVHKALGGELIEMNNCGHFTSPEMGSKKFPELLNKILS